MSRRRPVRAIATVPPGSGGRASDDRWRSLLRAVGLLVTVLAAGTVGYLLLGLSALDALYQSVTTVTTVGFREVGEPTAGFRVFTIVLVLLGAGLGEQRLRRLHPGTGDDEEVGPERPGREGDVDVVGVGVEGDHQRAGALDAGSAQHVLVGRVTLDDEAGNGAGTDGVAVDHDHRAPTGADEGVVDDATDPAPAAHDDVVLQGIDVTLHPPPREALGDAALDQ